MRLPADGLKARFARFAAALTLVLALCACGTTGGGGSHLAPLTSAPVNGPRADYPVVVGAPYVVGGTEYVPEDVLNYDRVGFIAADTDGGTAVSGAHHTLPLPSYVEVTSLDTGRTALVRIERRGPMTGQELVALSPGALAQLELAPGAQMQVAGAPPAAQPATAEAQRLPVPPIPASGASFVAPPLPSLPPSSAVLAGPAGAQASPPPAAAAPPLGAGEGGFVVQAAAFANGDNAARAANSLGGDVSRSGAYYRVRTGPFATRLEAEASLAKVRAAGYRDARIFTSG